VVVVVALLALQAREAERSSGRRMGFNGVPGVVGVLAKEVEPETPAARAGLQAGDQVVAVDGHRIGSIVDYDSRAAEFQRGRPVSLTILRRGREIALRAVPGVPTRWFTLVLSALASLAYLALALIALAHWRRDPRIRLLAAFASAVTIEMAMPVLLIGHTTLAAILTSAFFLLTGLELGLEFHLMSLIPTPHPWAVRHRWLTPLLYATGLTIGAICCAAFLAETLWNSQILPWTADVNNRILSRLVLPLWAVGVTALLVHQVRRTAEPQGRNQARLVLAGTLPWAVYLVATAGYELTRGALPFWTLSVETLVLLVSPVAFLIAIARYRLFDIEVVARHGLVYTSLTGALLLVFYAALGAGSALFSQLLDRREPVWAVSFATLILGLLFSPLRQAMQGWIERRFFPEREALRTRLLDLASELSAFGKLPRMASYLVDHLVEIFSARSAALLIANPETGLLSLLGSTEREPETGVLIPPSDPAVEQLRKAHRPLPAGLLLARSASLAHAFAEIESRGMVTPLLNQGRLVGVLGVGRRNDSRTYNVEELDLLSLLAHHVAIVFENARLFESATYESLTGLLRREAVLEQLDRELERAIRYRRPLAVAMADLDHFKEVNDRYGHLAGDLLLKRVARVLGSAVRSTDWIGRYGGEEFLLILPETELAGAAAVAEKIRSLVQGTSVPMEDGSPAKVTISIGIATLDDVAQQVQAKVVSRDLIAAADRSLYVAKGAGRNCIHPLVRVA
jgi:diguanylate cyclase (GGDEF)-like protein